MNNQSLTGPEQNIIAYLFRHVVSDPMDLANELPDDVSSTDLVGILQSMERRGIVRVCKDPKDPRTYEGLHTLYELAAGYV